MIMYIGNGGVIVKKNMLKFSSIIHLLSRIINVCMIAGVIFCVAVLLSLWFNDNPDNGFVMAGINLTGVLTAFTGDYEGDWLRANAIGLIVCLIIAGVLIIFILYEVSRITKNIINFETPFVSQNAICLKKCSVLTILYSLLPNMIGSIAAKLSLSAFGKSGDINIYYCEGSIFLAIIIFFISAIFKYGCELQEEVDEIL